MGAIPWCGINTASLVNVLRTASAVSDNQPFRNCSSKALIAIWSFAVFFEQQLRYTLSPDASSIVQSFALPKPLLALYSQIQVTKPQTPTLKVRAVQPLVTAAEVFVSRFLSWADFRPVSRLLYTVPKIDTRDFGAQPQAISPNTDPAARDRAMLPRCFTLPRS
jgi:hypothetical protein